jgi:hypothetical protein
MATRNGRINCWSACHASQQIEKLTHNLVNLGFQSRKIRLNARTNPPHKTSKPRTSLTKDPIGVRFPNALDLKNRGNASCSSVL